MIAIATKNPPPHYQVRISSRNSLSASAAWRIGPNANDVKNVCYAVGENGELLEVDTSATHTAPSRSIGFQPRPDQII
jgi:hypothetical protein